MIFYFLCREKEQVFGYILEYFGSGETEIPPGAQRGDKKLQGSPTGAQRGEEKHRGTPPGAQRGVEKHRGIPPGPKDGDKCS